jgi:hypothetical protein
MIEFLNAEDRKKIEGMLLVQQNGEWGPVEDGMFCSAVGKVSLGKITGAKLKPEGYEWNMDTQDSNEETETETETETEFPEDY